MIKEKNWARSNPNNRLFLIPIFLVVGAVSLFFRHKFLPGLSENPAYVLTIGGDSTYYLRLFDLAVDNFPAMPGRIDYYSNYPWGLKHFLPPVWSYVLALFSVPLSLIFNAEPARIAGVLMLLIGVATAVPIYFLARELFGKKVGIVSSLMSLLYPHLVFQSFSGIDHHMADIFLISSIYAIFLLLKRYFLEVNKRGFVILAIMGGAIVAFSILVSLSTLLIISIMLLPVIISLFVLDKEDVRPLFASLSSLFGSAALIFILLAITTSWFSPFLKFSELSYLHIAIFAFIALASLGVFFILKTGTKQSTFRVVMLIVLASGAVLMLAMPSIYQTLLDGYYRSIGSYPLGLRTNELKSSLKLSVNALSLFYSYLVVLAPLVFIPIISDWRKQGVKFESLFFTTMLIFIGFYTVQATYYSYYLSIFMIISYSLIAFKAAEFLHNIIKRSGRDRPGSNVLLTIITMLMLSVLLSSVIAMQPKSIKYNIINLSNYIEANTPPPGNFFNPAEKPSYSVMCNWGWSYALQYFSERATVSTGNSDAGIEGIVESERFFQTIGEEKGLEILANLNARYVLTSNFYHIWTGDISRIGEPSPNPDLVARTLSQDELRAGKNIVDKTMYARLYWGVLRPQAVLSSPPLHHFRLVYISAVDKKTPPLLLYEVVKGARIRVKAVPNQPVIIWTKIHTSIGYVSWRETAMTDGNGVFFTTVPYSTRGSNASTIVEPYTVQVGESKLNFNVEEKAVVNGEEIELRLPI